MTDELVTSLISSIKKNKTNNNTSNGYGKHTKLSSFKSDMNTTRSHSFFFSNRKGQHILKNPGIIKLMIDKSGIKETDIVLEIGPGTGNLTVQLLKKCKKVIAIEVDVRMISELRKRVHGSEYEKKLEIIHGDAIKRSFPFFNLCIANVPYQISSPLIFKLLSHRPHFRCAILMLQDEFGRRMVSRPGDIGWSRLSINTQLLARVNYIKKVKKNNFKPPPKVESCLIRIEPRRPPPPINFNEWDSLIKIAFERHHKLIRNQLLNKNVIKTLTNNYKTFCQLKNIPYNVNNINIKNIIDKILIDLDLNDKRARHLDVIHFMKLLVKLNKANIHFK